MNNKQIAFAAVWRHYMPAIRILVKKAVAAEQVITINQSDIEKAVGIKKSGYRFSITLIKGRPDMLYSNNDIAQSFITALSEDQAVKEYLLNNNYTFSFNSKYQLQIKSTVRQNETAPSETQETFAG